MRCKYCGKQIEEDSRFCIFCGKEQRKHVENWHELEDRTRFEDETQIKRDKEKNSFINIVRILLLIGLLGFFCPFVMVSCGSQTVEANGAELMTATSFAEKKKFIEIIQKSMYIPEQTL